MLTAEGEAGRIARKYRLTVVQAAKLCISTQVKQPHLQEDITQHTRRKKANQAQMPDSEHSHMMTMAGMCLIAVYLPRSKQGDILQLLVTRKLISTPITVTVTSVAYPLQRHHDTGKS